MGYTIHTFWEETVLFTWTDPEDPGDIPKIMICTLAGKTGSNDDEYPKTYRSAPSLLNDMPGISAHPNTK